MSVAGGRVAQVGGAVERASAVTVGGTGGDPTGVTRAQVLRYRVHAQQLGRTPTTERLAADVDVLDLGVQDSGTGGSAWALANRGLELSADPARWTSTLALAWTLRGAPHTYRRSDLDGVEAAATTPDDAGPVRLLGPFDLFLQARDRDLLVPDTDRQPGLWPTLGRPGAVLAGAEIVGTWRPRASGRRLRILLDTWVPWDEPLHDAVAQQSARLAEHRGLDLEAVTR
jgi:hypothetical protein